MHPTTFLRKQHRQVEALFKQLSKTDGGQGRRELMEQIVQHLRLHMKIEEEIFYPAVKELGSKKAEEAVLEAYEEHGVAKLVMAQLPRVDPEDERFDAKMTVFEELIKHHVEEEEGEMFKLAEKLDDETLASVGEQMAQQVENAGGGSGLTTRGARGAGRRRVA